MESWVCLTSVVSPCPVGSRDGSMGLWEVTDDVLTKSDARHNVSRVPVYAHITHKALKDIPKEDTNPDNCKVRALAFNNKNKVWGRQRGRLFLLLQLLGLYLGTLLLFPSQFLLHSLVLSPWKIEGWGLLVRNYNWDCETQPLRWVVQYFSGGSVFVGQPLRVTSEPPVFYYLSFAHAFAGALFWVWFS